MELFQGLKFYLKVTNKTFGKVKEKKKAKELKTWQALKPMLILTYEK